MSISNLIPSSEIVSRPVRKGKRPTGWVYFIGVPGAEVVKIGYSTNPIGRLRAISEQSPFEMHLITGEIGDHKRESELHREHASLRYRGEWFVREGALADYIALVLRWNGPEPWIRIQAQVTPSGTAPHTS